MSPYREGPNARHVPWWTRVHCACLGHDWKTVRVHNPLMLHLHPTAGVDAVCLRCGVESLWPTRYA